MHARYSEKGKTHRAYILLIDIILSFFESQRAIMIIYTVTKNNYMTADDEKHHVETIITEEIITPLTHDMSHC